MEPSGPQQYVVSARFVVEAWSGEAARETVVAFASPRHRRRMLMPSGGVITVETTGVRAVGPAVVLDAEILPPPGSPHWRGRSYYMDDDEAERGI